MEVPRRVRKLPFNSGPMADEEIGENGRLLFTFLDQEENASKTGITTC